MTTAGSTFADDQLERAIFGDGLIRYFNQMCGSGAVIAIDADWGHGKTWFARNLAQHLTNSGHNTSFLDAFENDYVDDPFLLLASEFLDAIPEETKKAPIIQKLTSVGIRLLPLMAGAAVKAAGRALTGISSEDIAATVNDFTEDSSDEARKLIEKRLMELQTTRTSVKEFRRSLESFTKELDKPFVFFVDELDRCRPDFAVLLLERIKHFFDVPNVIFVLLMNRKHLEASIKGLYGQEIEASRYLSKFIHAFVTFPERTDGGSDSRLNFISYSLVKSGLNERSINKQLLRYLYILTSRFSLSLRDIERITGRLSLMGPSRIAGNELVFCWLAVLQLIRPSIFNALLERKKGGHKDAQALATELSKTEDESGEFAALLYLHEFAYRAKNTIRDSEYSILEKHIELNSGFKPIESVAALAAYLSFRK